jgi:hypothetical protein
VEEDKHLNLFYTYRTNHIEDNVTRALAVTLAGLSPVHLRLFLRQLCLKHRLDLRERLQLIADPNFQFDLQLQERPEDEKLNESTGVIVGINYSGEQRLTFDEELAAEGGARPDMMISDKENGITFIVETKLRDDLYREQIARHFTRFFDVKRSKLSQVLVEISWNDIADLLAQLRQQSDSPLESYLVKHLNEYLDFLGLTEFVAFNQFDFVEQNTDKLQKFIAFLTSELGSKLGFEEYSGNNMLFLKEPKHENVWIDYDDEKGLTLGVNVGSGKKWRSQQMRDWIRRDKNGLKALLVKFRSGLSSLQLSVSLAISSVFRWDRFRTERLWNVRGCDYFPDGFDKFRLTFTDERINSYRRITKREIGNLFQEEIKQQVDTNRLDSEQQFPRWDAPDFLQYCYFDIVSEIPRNRLVGTRRGELVQEFQLILTSMRDLIVELSVATVERTASSSA